MKKTNINEDLLIPTDSSVDNEYLYDINYDNLVEDNYEILTIGYSKKCGIWIKHNISGLDLRSYLKKIGCEEALLVTSPVFNDEYKNTTEDINPNIIPIGATAIFNEAFANFNNLKSINIPEGVETIKDFGFSSCVNLISVHLPDSLKGIEQFSFLGCSSLKSITIPNGVKYIFTSAFKDCSALESITIPNSVKEIWTSVFENCYKLKNICIDKNNEYAIKYFENLGYINGEIKLIDNDVNESLIMPSDSSADDDYIKKINHTDYESLIKKKYDISYMINDRYFSFGYGWDSFYNIIPNYNQPGVSLREFFSNVSSDSARVFILTFDFKSKYKNQIINPEIIPAGVTVISTNAFTDCNLSDSVIIPNGVKLIDSFAFSNCKTLKSITIPESVEFIEMMAFAGCEKLKTVVIEGDVEFGDYAFSNCPHIEFIYTNEDNYRPINENLSMPGDSSVTDDSLRIGNYNIILKEMETAFDFGSKWYSDEEISMSREYIISSAKRLTYSYGQPTNPSTVTYHSDLDEHNIYKIVKFNPKSKFYYYIDGDKPVAPDVIPEGIYSFGDDRKRRRTQKYNTNKLILPESFSVFYSVVNNNHLRDILENNPQIKEVSFYDKSIVDYIKISQNRYNRHNYFRFFIYSIFDLGYEGVISDKTITIIITNKKYIDFIKQSIIDKSYYKNSFPNKKSIENDMWKDCIDMNLTINCCDVGGNSIKKFKIEDIGSVLGLDDSISESVVNNKSFENCDSSVVEINNSVTIKDFAFGNNISEVYLTAPNISIDDFAFKSAANLNKLVMYNDVSLNELHFDNNDSSITILVKDVPDKKLNEERFINLIGKLKPLENIKLERESIDECDGGVASPMSTAVNTVGIGDPVPPQPDGTPGSGDVWGIPFEKKSVKKNKKIKIKKKKI